LQKRIIALRVFHDRHTSQNIFRMIKIILDEYNLIEIFFSIRFDNASANTASISELQNLCQPIIGGKFFHVRCACHILNLCVQDGLKALAIEIAPIRNAIAYLWSKTTVMKEWAKFCRSNGKNPKKFARDVPNRWNSTYELLNASNKYSGLLCEFFMIFVPDIPLHQNNWIVCKKILEILKVFNDATFSFSSVYKPTAHLFLFEACNIMETLHETQVEYNLQLSISEMSSKWLSYYKNIPPIYLVAMVFDPRFKLDGLQESLNLYYGLILPSSQEVDEKVNFIIFEVKNLISHLYSDFYNTFASQVPSSTSEPSDSSSRDTTKVSRMQQIMMQRQKRLRGSSTTTELDIYLTTSFDFCDDSSIECRDFPILQWWKKQSKTFPILSLIAKQILATPASTVAVEQAFSASGIILDEKRSTMSPDSLEAQTCLDDWIKAANRDQELKIDEDSDIYETTEGSSSAPSSGHGSSPDEEE
jgi:hypothetical protein